MRISPNLTAVTSNTDNRTERPSQIGRNSHRKVLLDSETAHGSLAQSMAAGLPKLSGSVSAPGMSADQLSSMLQTSLKMKSIRNDLSIPEDAKRKLLKPLELANQNAVLIAEAKAEQEEKAQIVEAAEGSADTIQTSGQEIAESRDVESAMPTAPRDSDTPEHEEGTRTASDITLAKASTPASPAAGTSPNYSVSPQSNVGRHVDVQA